MKTSNIFLAVVALSFITTKASNVAKSLDLDQQELASLTIENTKQEIQLVLVNQEFSIDTIKSSNNDSEIFYPTSVIKETYVKTVEDVIFENKLITETQEEEFQPLSIETTIEDQIVEDNQIIESTISNELFPLDYKKINSKIQCVKVNNNDATVTLDLKL